MILDEVYLIDREVEAFDGERGSLDVNWSELRVNLVFSKSCILQRIELNPYDFPEEALGVVVADILLLICKRVVLASLFYFVLDISRVIVLQVDLLYI